MQKPWSFKAIEFILYVQIGLVLGLIIGFFSFVIVPLIAYWVGNIELSRSILSMFWGVWSRVMMILGDEIGKGSFYERLGELLGLFSELIMSSVILIILKTKNLIVIKRTAILVLIIRTVLGGLLIYPFPLPLHVKSYISILIFCLICIAAFLSLKPAQYYAIAIFMLVLGITIGISPVDYLSIQLFELNGYTFFFIYSSIFIVAFLFLKSVRHYLQMRSQIK